MLIISNNMDGILEKKRFLTSTFDMKDLRLVGVMNLVKHIILKKMLDKFKHLNFKEEKWNSGGSIGVCKCNMVSYVLNVMYLT